MNASSEGTVRVMKGEYCPNERAGVAEYDDNFIHISIIVE